MLLLLLLSLLFLSGGYDVTLEGALSCGEVGTPLSHQDRTLLQLHPLRSYSTGELVAVARHNQEAADAAALAAEQRAAAATATATAGNEGVAGSGGSRGGGSSMLCYARVVSDVSPPAGAAAHLVALEVEPGRVEQVISTQVFSFISSTAAAGEGAAAAEGAGDGASSSSGVVLPGSSNGAGPAATAVATDAGGGGVTNAAGVSPVEVAGAVADMMRAAGLPLDLDREQLLNQALAAQQALVEARRALEGERSAREEQESELDSLRTGWQCRVCFSREVDTAFSGCGHMFCSQCSRSLSRCAVCRRASQQLKLFK